MENEIKELFFQIDQMTGSLAKIRANLIDLASKEYIKSHKITREQIILSSEIKCGEIECFEDIKDLIVIIANKELRKKWIEWNYRIYPLKKVLEQNGIDRNLFEECAGLLKHVPFDDEIEKQKQLKEYRRLCTELLDNLAGKNGN
jgi:hypothetical protein